MPEGDGRRGGDLRIAVAETLGEDLEGAGILADADRVERTNEEVA